MQCRVCSADVDPNVAPHLLWTLCSQCRQRVNLVEEERLAFTRPKSDDIWSALASVDLSLEHGGRYRWLPHSVLSPVACLPGLHTLPTIETDGHPLDPDLLGLQPKVYVTPSARCDLSRVEWSHRHVTVSVYVREPCTPAATVFTVRVEPPDAALIGGAS